MNAIKLGKWRECVYVCVYSARVDSKQQQKQQQQYDDEAARCSIYTATYRVWIILDILHEIQYARNVSIAMVFPSLPFLASFFLSFPSPPPPVQRMDTEKEWKRTRKSEK